MSRYLCVSVRFLDPLFHGKQGKGDGGKPEWPPSPFRLFQALVAAAARVGGGVIGERDRAALEWLAALSERSAPVITAPVGEPTETGYRISVPNNDTDRIAEAWVAGDRAEAHSLAAKLRTMKPVRPTRLVGGDTIFYTWTLPDGTPDGHPAINSLAALARNVVVLGWGVDQVVGRCEVIDPTRHAQVAGERWTPTGRHRAANILRVPVTRTLRALEVRHQRFMDRVSDGGVNRVPDLAPPDFAPTGYRRENDIAPRPFAAFQLRTPDDRGFQAYGPALRTHIVVGMLRRIAKEAAERSGWGKEMVNGYVLGHGAGKNGQACGPDGDQRFAYLPLPSIEARGNNGRTRTLVVTSIRRLLVVEPMNGTGEHATWAERSLPGRVLVPGPDDPVTPPALLRPIRDLDEGNTRRHYIDAAPIWSTVTPVLLPGLGSRSRQETQEILRVAIQQAGLPTTLAGNAVLEWGRVAYWPGVDSATRFLRPKHLEHYPRVHVRISWRDERGRPVAVPGPICIGAGRYYGLGLFAAEREYSR